MATRLTIANLALAFIGDTKIAGLTDDNPRADACATHIDSVIGEVFRELKPNSVIRRVILDDDDFAASDPVFGYAYAFEWDPNNLILEIQPLGVRYVVERVALGGGDYQTQIFADEPELEVIYAYVGTIGDISEHDDLVIGPEVVHACAMRLAWLICDLLTGSLSRKQDALNAYTKAISTARAQNQMESPQENNDGAFSWLTAKRT